MSLFKRFKIKKENKIPATIPVASTSPSSSSAVDAGGRSGIRTTLQNLSTVLEIGKSVGEATQILGPMKTVCGVLQTLVDIALRVQANGENLQDLVDKLKRQLEFIKQQLTVLDGPDFREAKLGDQGLVKVFESYIVDLEKLHVKLNALGDEYIAGKKKIPKRVMIVKAVEEEISDLTRKLDDSFQLFMNSINSFIAGQTVLIRNELADLRERFALSQLPLADARGNMHNSCLEGTRVELLEQISHWAADDSAVPIIALIDLAGTGKSTIAIHMARQWEKNRTSATQFFFSKPTTITGKNFASTVARDIAQSIPHLRPIILSALKEHTDIAARSIQEQLEWIVFGPLRSTSQTHIMVIDALDECSAIDRSTILDSILKFLSEYPAGQSPLKVFLTSRPEADIMDHFNSPTNKNFIFRLDFSLRPELSQYNLDDIRLYVETYLGDKLTPDNIDKFITRTGGLFIWASTAVQFLGQAKNFNARFQTLMSPKRKSPLDDLYSEILKASLAGYQEEEEVDLKKVLQAICVAREPLTVAEMDEILSLDNGVAESVVKSLSSILSDGDSGQPVYVLHPTFLEHLQNPSRPGPVFISNEEAEGLVAGGCLSSLCSGLRYDICRVLQPKTAAPKNEDVEDLKQRIEERTTPALRYAATHALSHVRPCLGDEGIVAKLHTFFESKLLDWIELISFLGKVYSAIQELYDLKCGIEEVKSSSNTMLLDNQEWCDETLELIQPYQAVIKASAMQVYFSALPFFPQTTRISRCYLPSLKQSIPKVLYQRTPSSRSKALTGHQSWVNSISISPDDRRVASIDIRGKLRRWDIVAGGCIEELNTSNVLDLKPRIGLISGFSFDPIMQPLTDGTFAAMLSGGNITLRDMRTEAVLWEVQCAIGTEQWRAHASTKPRAIFSPNGRFLASCFGAVIQIWDVETGKEIWRKDIGGRIPYIALSPDSTLLANVDGDWVVHVWDIANGKSVALPTGIIDSRSSFLSTDVSLFFSPDGTILAGSFPTGDIKLWYLKDGEPIHHQDVVNSGAKCFFAFSPSSQLIAYASYSTIHIYDVASGKTIGEPLTGHTDKITCLAFLSNDRTLVSGSMDTTVRVWELGVKAVEQPHLKQDETNGAVSCLMFSFDGRHLASGYNGGEICLWDVAAGKVKWQLDAFDVNVGYLAFSSNGHTLASGNYMGDVNFYDVDSGKAVGSVAGSARKLKVMSSAVSSDFRFVAIGGYNYVEGSDDVVILKIPSGEMVAERHLELDEMDLAGISSLSFHLHQGKDFLVINKKYLWNISTDLFYNSDEDAPFKLADLLHSDAATVKRSWVSIDESFTFTLPPHVDVHPYNYRKGRFACGGYNGVELIIDCSHLL